VLDVGCGVGYGADMLAAGGALEVEGIDVDEATVAAARESFGSERVRFRAADALQALRALEPGTVDAIVCFEALEHLPDPEPVLDRFAELVRAGVRLVLSVPNSRAFAERNEFHHTDYGYDEALAAFGRIDGATVLYQHIAEGALLAGEEPVDRAEVHGLEEADPEYANCFVAVAGFPAERLASAIAELGVVAKPNLNRWMLELQQANAELWQTNQRLAREHLGRSDAAAASTVSRYEREKAALEKTLAEREARIEELTIVAKRNDDLYKQQLVWNDAKRYRAADRVHEIVTSIPGLTALAGLVRRLVTGRAG
jgi:SAM-dependent methyltransferase